MTLVVKESVLVKKKTPRLGTAELEVLEMLWRDGPVNLSEAHESLGQPIGYTTVQTRLNRLVKKGVVKKSKHRPAQYSAGISREAVNKNDLDTLVAKVNQGKFIPLVSHLVGDRQLTKEEINQLKSIISEAESKSNPSNRRTK
jgi:BlaI family penicillinase repressor